MATDEELMKQDLDLLGVSFRCKLEDGTIQRVDPREVRRACDHWVLDSPAGPMRVDANVMTEAVIALVVDPKESA